MKKRIIQLLIILLAGFWLWSSFHPFWNAPEGVINFEPIQTPAKAEPFPFNSYSLFPRHFVLTPVANYDITARVLHKKLYLTKQYFGDLIPYDLALGWQGMSDLKILVPYMSFSQIGSTSLGMRAYTYEYRWKNEPPPPEMVIAMASDSNKANNHIIPANAKILFQLARISTGDLVRLKGYLVNAAMPSDPDFSWTTSTSRTDRGFYRGGANNPDCETIYVTEAEILR